jgi:two-component system response regulator PilR (NtrC family)
VTDLRTALIVDDEADIRELLDITLSRMDLNVHTAADLQSARDLLESHEFDLCFTDMRLPDGSGIDLVRHIARTSPGLPTAVITAHGNMNAAVDALKAGAFDFVSKPVDLQLLRNLVNTALRLAPGHRSEDGVNHRLLGESAPMKLVRQTIDKLARSQAPVFISGESGVGKELAARSIHELGPRAEGPLESELFGHRRGSFTGANADKPGLFQTANGGTIFLDEIADLPLNMQVKLLRVIQEKAVRAVGASREEAVDVRVLSATHQDLTALVNDGRFRQDLYYRINVIELHMPALRERGQDIAILADHFLQCIATDWGTTPLALGDDALQALSEYPFPGNVRELENILERAMTMCESDSIRRQDLQLKTSESNGGSPTPDIDTGLPLEQLIDQVEREAIIRALEETRYNKTAAAKKLGITFRALRYRLKKLDLE